MQIKRVRENTYQISDVMDDAPNEDEPITFTVRAHLEHGTLVFARAWAWGSQVGPEDVWLFESWLEEHEGEILAELEIES